MSWTTNQRTFCVSTYLETKSFKPVQAKYRRKFDFNKIPQKSQIHQRVKNLKQKEQYINSVRR